MTGDERERSGASDRERVLALVQRHGWNSTAFQALEAPYAYFFSGDDAVVAYLDTGRAWVAAGAPIAASDAIGDVAAAFVGAARAADRRCCFMATEERMRDAVGHTLRSIAIGEQPVWDPRKWPAILASSRSLREQLRRARAKGVRIRLLTEDQLVSPSIRASLTSATERWLATKEMAQMGFLVHIEPFTFPAFRRCFAAEIDNRIVGFASVIPVPARGGWFLEDLVRDPSAPNGTPELLTDAVMQWAAAGGSAWVTLGLAPLAGEVTGFMRAARTGTSLFYDFDGLHRYKLKLRPESWSRIYVMYPPTQHGATTIADVLAAFSRGGLLRFGMRTVLRGPSAVLLVLLLLLILWIGVLAFGPAAAWFPTPWQRWAWVVFDLLVAAGLYRLLARPSRWLVTTLAVATTADVVLTAVQAVTWNLPRATTVLDNAIIACACAAPLIASAILWGARRTRWRSGQST